MRGSEPQWFIMEFKGDGGHILYVDRVPHSKPRLRVKICKQSWHRWDIFVETQMDIDGRSVLGWMLVEKVRWKTQALSKAKEILEACWQQQQSSVTPTRFRRSSWFTRWRHVAKEGGHS